MDARKLARFDGTHLPLACPVCGERLVHEPGATRVTCANRHSFDIARQGYVNLLRGGKHQQTYDRASFEDRRRVFESGLYDPIGRALCGIVDALANETGDEVSGEPAAAVAPALAAGNTGRSALRILDAGCGEGHFARLVRAKTGAHVAAFDISKESVHLAATAQADDGIVWFVADLAHIPLRANSVDVILNIFSPANYREFQRILAPGGHIVKVIPTSRHLHEVRELAGAFIAHEEYSNRRVLDHFAANCTLKTTQRASRTLELDEQTRAALIAMTPLLFNVDTKAVDWSYLTHATVEADILVGSFPA